ncbi:hypothetical protein B0T14DRAFT_207697 [Immersiella caudata]|uniref:Uncharacterized protein n=1 Tax=Immersiella caudata TaxID=314043 RepID=A0AA40BZM7_9PEZI|nr:hypothetical protein B0T14DRAFT_207697 [Immersiella caudata]
MKIHYIINDDLLPTDTTFPETTKDKLFTMRRSCRSGRPKPFDTLENLQARWGDPPTTFDAEALEYLCCGLIREFNLRPRAVRRDMRIRAEWVRMCRLLCDVGSLLSTRNNEASGWPKETDFNNFGDAAQNGGKSNGSVNDYVDTPSEPVSSEDGGEFVIISLPKSGCVSRRESVSSVDLDGKAEELAPAAGDADGIMKTGEDEKGNLGADRTMLFGEKSEAWVDLKYKIPEEEPHIEQSEKQPCIHSPTNSGSSAGGDQAADSEKWDKKGLEDKQQPPPPPIHMDRTDDAPNITLVMPGCSARYPTKLHMRVPPNSKLPRKPRTDGDAHLKRIAVRTWREFATTLDEKVADA